MIDSKLVVYYCSETCVSVQWERHILCNKRQKQKMDYIFTYSKTKSFSFASHSLPKPNMNVYFVETFGEFMSIETDLMLSRVYVLQAL